MTTPILLTFDEAKDLARIYIGRRNALQAEITRYREKFPEYLQDKVYLIMLKSMLNMAEGILSKIKAANIPDADGDQLEEAQIW